MELSLDVIGYVDVLSDCDPNVDCWVVLGGERTGDY